MSVNQHRRGEGFGPEGEAHEGTEESFGKRLAAAIGATESSQEFRKGCYLLEEGREGGSMYVVTEGLFKATKCDELRREVVIHLAEPGDLIGIELMFDQASSARWEAVIQSRARPLPVRAVRDGLTANPTLALEVSEVLMRRVARAENKVRDFAHKSARQRASDVLLLRARSRQSGDPIVRDLTRQDLAAMAGMTPETFIRILSTFREKGIVETQGRLITILDHTRLANIAGVSARRLGGAASPPPTLKANGWAGVQSARNAVS